MGPGAGHGLRVPPGDLLIMSGDQFFGPPFSIIFLNAGAWNLWWT